MTTTKSPRWRRLIGVYDSNGGLLGELAYLTGRLLGIAHCALCDVLCLEAALRRAVDGPGPVRDPPSREA